MAHDGGGTHEELRRRAEPHVQRAFVGRRGILQAAMERGDTQALWEGWSSAMETALYGAFSQEEEEGHKTISARGRGIARVRLRNLGPPRPRWEDNKTGMEELFQCERGAHARKVGRTFTAVRDRLRKRSLDEPIGH